VNNVPAGQVDQQLVSEREPLFGESVERALGELAGAAREGLLALAVEVGLGVLEELLEEEVTGLVGPMGRHDPGRCAYRHGHERGEVTLGARRVPVDRPAGARGRRLGRAWACDLPPLRRPRSAL
jgi:putative transposase